MQKGDRVELSPGLDAWMQGDRYGVVTWTSKSGAHLRVKLDKSRRTLRLPVERVDPIR